MDAIVLAGGYATRLWPITWNRPKMFLPLGGETVIDETLSALESDPRIGEVYISTNAKFADDFEEYLTRSGLDKPRVCVEDTATEDEKLGVVGALATLIAEEPIDDDLLVVAGDNLIDFDLGEFVTFFERRRSPILAAYDIKSKERASAYGLVELEGTEVINFQEKPRRPRSTLVSLACYAFPHETLPLLAEYLAAGENPDEPGWFLQWLHERSTIHAFRFDGAWFDIGTPKSYLEAVSWKLNDGTDIADTAVVENSDIGPGVQIMQDATVRNARLRDTVVFPGATIRNASVMDSIVDRGVLIEGYDVMNGVVGSGVVLQSESPPSKRPPTLFERTKVL